MNTHLSPEKLKQLLDAVRKQRAYSEQQAAPPAANATALNIPRNPEWRRHNLRLLRAFFDERQVDFSPLIGVDTQSEYSKIETGELPFDSHRARRIEKELNLPDGWFDRNNMEAALVSNDEIALIAELRKSPLGALPSLIETIRQVRAQRASIEK